MSLPTTNTKLEQNGYKESETKFQTWKQESKLSMCHIPGSMFLSTNMIWQNGT